MPVAKKHYIHSLQESGNGKIVIFVGDGTNDAVAVAQADIGGTIGSALELPANATDVVLLGGLEGLLRLLEVSKKSFRRIVFNFVWSAVYNILAI